MNTKFTYLVTLLVTLLPASQMADAHQGHPHHRHQPPTGVSTNHKEKFKQKWWAIGLETGAHTKNFHHGLREPRKGGAYYFAPFIQLTDHVTIGGASTLGTHKYYTAWDAYVNFSYEYKKWLGEIGYSFRRRQPGDFKPKKHDAHHHHDDHDDDDDEDHHSDEEKSSEKHHGKYHDDHSFNFGLSYLGFPYIVPSIHGHWIFRENVLYLDPAINAYIPLIQSKKGSSSLILNPAIEFGIRAYESKKSRDEHADDHHHSSHEHPHHLHHTVFRLQLDYSPNSFVTISPYFAQLVPLESSPDGLQTFGGIKIRFIY
ncbi:MAG: hypothetical protein NZM04_00070 [Methylacidiphilales bacterium]|nr:hypothetical protein [Candidatus Methylacidiphilales bacterium]MDW8348858.1 hypothetical protein [Verrucomicrobiae bacterium]